VRKYRVGRDKGRMVAGVASLPDDEETGNERSSVAA
jgi:hypothetical protein